MARKVLVDRKFSCYGELRKSDKHKICAKKHYHQSCSAEQERRIVDRLLEIKKVSDDQGNKSLKPVQPGFNLSVYLDKSAPYLVNKPMVCVNEHLRSLVHEEPLYL